MPPTEDTGTNVAPDPSTEGSSEGAGNPVAPQQAVDLTQLDEFRNYQSSMDKQLSELQAQLAAAKKERDALAATREYDQKTVAEMQAAVQQQTAAQQRANEMRQAWGSSPGWNDAILLGAETPEQVDANVYAWLRGRLNQPAETPKPVVVDQVDTTLEPSLTPQTTIPRKTPRELMAQYQKEVREEGKDRLLDWLAQTEPLVRTKQNVTKGAQAKV